MDEREMPPFLWMRACAARKLDPMTLATELAFRPREILGTPLRQWENKNKRWLCLVHWYNEHAGCPPEWIIPELCSRLPLIHNLPRYGTAAFAIKRLPHPQQACQICTALPHRTRSRNLGPFYDYHTVPFYPSVFAAHAAGVDLAAAHLPAVRRSVEYAQGVEA